MSLETDVQGLTQATTDLLVAVNVSKATLDGKVADAGSFATASLNSANASAASAATATTQATAAGTARTGAETARDAAVVAQNNAVAVVTGGTATLTPSATKIPLSDAQGKIAKGWLTNTDLVEQTDIGTGPNEIPLNQFLGELAYLDAQNIPTLGINVVNAATANVTNLMQVTEISNAVPSLNLDFAKVKQLDPRITFTRASTGTYYDGKTVAKAEENLLLQSQAIGTTGWIQNNSTSTLNNAVAPDGTTTASLITLTSAGNLQTYQLTPTLTGQITMSCYIKTGSITWMQFFYGGVNTEYANFNVSSGTLGNYSGTATITSVGNGWYRCTHTFTPSTNISNVTINTVDSGTAARAAITTASSGTWYLWGAQLEQRSFATAYTPTTTAPITNYIPVLQTASAGTPRFDHNPITGESLGLLIEEQRTNLLLQSETFENVAWAKINTTITANTVVAPDGTLTGDKLTSSTVIVDSHQTYRIGIAITNGATHTWSVYMKQGEYAWGIVNAFSASDSRTYFNLANGTVGTVSSGSTAAIAPVGNGWYRCSVTRVAGAATGGLSVEMANADNVPTFAATVGSGIYIWGAQLEAGAFPTSYIPTVASQVTRAADSAVMTGANFSSWYRQNQGTLYSEATAIAPGAVTGFSSVEVSNGNFDRRMFHGVSGNVYRAYYQLPITSMNTNATAIAGVFAKLATGYDASGVSMSAAGGTVVTGSAWTDSSAANTLRIGATFGSVGNNYVRKITYYPQRLSNAELVEMTA